MKESDITIGITSFLRPEALERLLRSIKATGREYQVLVVDQSRKPPKVPGNVQLVQAEFDVGLSRGRNILLENVTTPYLFIVDDDTMFGEAHESDLCPLTEYLGRDGCNLTTPSKRNGDPAPGYSIEVKDKHIYINNVEPGKGAWPVDMHPNYLMLDVAFWKENNIRWDPKLKINEHLAFFYDHLGILNPMIVDGVNILHAHVMGSPMYRKGRRAHAENHTKFVRDRGILDIHDNSRFRYWPRKT